MAYTPVPAVAAGDTIDEVFIYTYWVDNMAAGVPDIFSTKGQLAVGLDVDEVGVLNVGTDGEVLHADSTQALGVIWKNINAIYRRQGGSATNWNSQGSTNYTPANSLIQVGTGRVPFAVSATGNKEITFPVAYSAVPIVLITLISIPLTYAIDRLQVGLETTTRFFTYVELDSTLASGSVDFNWMAIGPAS